MEVIVSHELEIDARTPVRTLEMHKLLWWWFLSQFQCWVIVGGCSGVCERRHPSHLVCLLVEPHRAWCAPSPSAFPFVFSFTPFSVALQPRYGVSIARKETYYVM